MKRLTGLAAIVLPLAALLVFGLVMRQNYTLRQKVAARAAPVPKASRFIAGDELATLPVYDTNGRKASLDFGSSRKRVVVVAPQCGSCAKTMKELDDDGATTVISVAPPETTRTAVAASSIAAITYSAASPRVADGKLTAFPQVLLVDRGKIVRTCATPEECRAKS